MEANFTWVDKPGIDKLRNLWMKSDTDASGSRVYTTPDGKKYPSVTTVMGLQSKDAIDQWKQRVGKEEAARVSRNASRNGNVIHWMCEQYLRNKDITELYRALPFHQKEQFLGLKKLLDKHVNNIYTMESPLYSKYLRLAGRVDLIAEWDGVLSIIDFKTSLKLKKREWVLHYFYQGCCYAIMFEEMTGKPIKQIVVPIAILQDLPQIFVEDRDDHVKGLINAIKFYHRENLRNTG